MTANVQLKVVSASAYPTGMSFTSLAQRLKKRRDDLRLKQDVVAGAVGVSQSQVSLLEKGKRETSLENLDAWAGALGYALVVDLVPADSERRNLVQLLSDLDDNDTELAARLIALLPRLTRKDRKLWLSDLQVLEEEYGEAETAATDADSKAV